MHAPSTRRDPRHALREGAGVIRIPAGPGRAQELSAALTKISAAGIAFLAEDPADGLLPGAILRCVEVRVGECVLQGDIAVRDLRRMDDTSSEVGGLFLPASPSMEARLMALLAGIEAVRGD